ncbi:DUF6380 family protein [Streptomyces sp. NPDC006622]|uniref:DUF6380 family protein n=1 Tax=Streptomyces sp. NPDC006622 TaxID=3155459 RepID=UPI0033A90D38
MDPRGDGADRGDAAGGERRATPRRGAASLTATVGRAEFHGHAGRAEKGAR